MPHWYNPADWLMFVTLGEDVIVNDPHLSIFLRPDQIRIGAHTRIDGMVKIEGTVTIGEFVHIASFSHIGAGGGEVIFGSHSGCSSHVIICSGQPDLGRLHISAADLPENQHPLRMKTVIGEYVVIFAGAIICPNIVIGDGAVIGAGAVVTHDVPPWEIHAGNPARKIGERTIPDAELELWMRGEMRMNRPQPSPPAPHAGCHQ